ncbi:AAA family ATPase [Butyrivibrio sp. MC2013]|uniref:AAA family ATPase n=1 Tax=Butyrivibrio sp. MC2013 TaxID=1280686 RepID=UPI0005662B89
MIYSDDRTVDAGRPILTLNDKDGVFEHHLTGIFMDPAKAFAFDSADPEEKAYISGIDSRFVEFVKWLGINRISVRLTGENREGVFCVYKIRELESGPSGKLSGQDGFLQYMIARLLSGDAVRDTETEEEDADDDSMKLTSLQSITDFLDCAGRTFPVNIRSWARRNLAVAKSEEVSQEERRHAQRALSMMMNIQWRRSLFPPIDPVKARAILDEELYGMEKVKQRIIETIIQINRTGRLPAYGLLLIGPAGTGKSQIAYAVARILGLPWAGLDMSSVHDPEQLTGSSRIYANAKPGSIMEAFSRAGQSDLVFIINELDKADSESVSGNPADALLTLLDNLGYTDNYMECMIPTTGVYPVATANDKSRISEPLLTRFAVIELPDYTAEEKKEIFLRFALPKVLKRMELTEDECRVSSDGADQVVEHFKNVSGVRDLEQAAEHLAAHALYLIETTGVKSVVYDGDTVRELLQ